MKRQEVVLGMKVRRIRHVLKPSDNDMINGIIVDSEVINEGVSGKVLVKFKNGITRAVPLNQLKESE